MTIESIEILLLVAALVAMLTQRVRLPYTIGLVAAGVVLGLLSFGPQIDLSDDTPVEVAAGRATHLRQKHQ